MRPATTIVAVSVLWGLAVSALLRIDRWRRREEPEAPADAPTKTIRLHCRGCHTDCELATDKTVLLRDDDGELRVWATCLALGCGTTIRSGVTLDWHDALHLLSLGVVDGVTLGEQLAVSLDEVTW